MEAPTQKGPTGKGWEEKWMLTLACDKSIGYVYTVYMEHNHCEMIGLGL